MTSLKHAPKDLGTWVGLGRAELERWLEDAYERHFSPNGPPLQAVHEVRIDGAKVTNVLTMCCAFGEAVNGPGGSFGRNLDGLDDCLFGGFGLETPGVIVWENSEISRRAFDSAGEGPSFDEIVDTISSVSDRTSDDNWHIELRLE